MVGFDDRQLEEYFVIKYSKHCIIRAEEERLEQKRAFVGLHILS